jgi:hypothetical protein
MAWCQFRPLIRPRAWLRVNQAASDMRLCTPWISVGENGTGGGRGHDRFCRHDTIWAGPTDCLVCEWLTRYFDKKVFKVNYQPPAHTEARKLTVNTNQ